MICTAEPIVPRKAGENRRKQFYSWVIEVALCIKQRTLWHLCSQC